jgi:hypothetical protein
VKVGQRNRLTFKSHCMLTCSKSMCQSKLKSVVKFYGIEGYWTVGGGD